MRQVHIHLHRRAGDAGFEESKHPRDGGKFASSPGAGKSDYARARESEHDDRRDADYAKRRAEAKADADAAKKKPAKEPKPKAEPKAPAKTQEQKDAEERVKKRQAASAAAARGDTALAKQMLSQIRRVDQEVEREERRR